MPFYSKNILILLLLLALPVLSAKPYRFKGKKCTIRVKKSEKASWKKTKKKIKKGRKVDARKFPNKAKYLIFKLNEASKIQYTAKKKCFKKIKKKKKTTEDEDSDIDETEPELTDSDDDEEQTEEKEKSSLWYATFSTVSWFEDLTLQSDGPTSQSIKLRMLNLSLGLGAGWEKRKPKYDWGFHGSLLYGRAHIGNSDINQSPSYESRNADVITLKLDAKALYRPSSGYVNFGINIPILYSMSDFIDLPVSGTSFKYSVSRDSPVLIGLLLEARVERWGAFFSQKLGFIQNPNNFIWSVDISYVF